MMRTRQVITSSLNRRLVHPSMVQQTIWEVRTPQNKKLLPNIGEMRMSRRRGMAASRYSQGIGHMSPMLQGEATLSNLGDTPI